MARPPATTSADYFARLLDASCNLAVALATSGQVDVDIFDGKTIREYAQALSDDALAWALLADVELAGRGTVIEIGRAHV